MKNLETILNLSEEADSYIELASQVDGIYELESSVVTTMYSDGDTIEEELEIKLVEFSVTFIDSFVKLFLDGEVLDENMPIGTTKSIERRKGMKYVLDHLKAISAEAKEELL